MSGEGIKDNTKSSQYHLISSILSGVTCIAVALLALRYGYSMPLNKVDNALPSDGEISIFASIVGGIFIAASEFLRALTKGNAQSLLS